MKKILMVLFLITAVSTNAQWSYYTLPYEGIANALCFYDLSKGLSFGHTIMPFNERMFYTTNSGGSWNPSVYPAEIRAIVDAQFINATTIYACGAENVNVFNKAGYKNDFASYPKYLRERYLQEGKREYFSEYKGTFIKSTDGGLNWQRGSIFDTLTGYFNDIHFFDMNTGYALIDSNPTLNTKLYRTTNAGVNWNLISAIDTNAEVEKMIFLDANTIVAKGFYWGGRIYRSTNTGLNWTTTFMPMQIDCITFYNATTGIVCGVSELGMDSKIYKTTDAGLQWNEIYSTPLRMFTNIMTVPSTGTAFGIGVTFDTSIFASSNIATLKTTNYGATWVSKELNTTQYVMGLWIADSNNYYMSGGNMNEPAVVLKSTNGGNVFVNTVGSEVPDSYSLGQNYPNPFNPVTKIRISIQKSESRSQNSEVSLKVYDVMGREVQTLVNERLEPGTYETTFDGSKLTSGVYFYQMKAGDFRVTKSMLLIK
ncbi:MAG: T9SS type A sorting domain-containing protein [Candidatus Kapaibacterium sp.]